VLALAGPAKAGDRQTVRAAGTTDRPGAPTGSVMDMRFFDPTRPGGKPPALDKLLIRLATGTRIDHAAIPACTASDAELMARGEAACPPDSKVQSGRIVMDTGSPFVFPRLIRLRTATFNEQGGFVSIGDGENVPIRGVVRSRIRDGVVEVDYADAPGYPSSDPYAAMTVMFTSGPAIDRGGRAFVRTPPACPASGHWITRYTFIYHDGVRQSETTRAACRRDANPSCLPRRLRFTQRGVGPIRLGTRRSQLLRLPTRPPRRSGRSLSWCVDRSGGRVGAHLDRRGRAELVLSTAGGHGARRVQPGRSARRLSRAYPGRRVLFRGVYRAGPRSRLLIGARRGRVRFVGVASRRLLSERRLLRRALRASRR
jgi:hypothetical protein